MIINNDELLHYGVKGMKWGVRRYQNKDGTLTHLGAKRKRQALDSIRADKERLREYTDKYRRQLKDAEPKSRWVSVSERAEREAKFFINGYKNLKISELREKAYNDNTMLIGRDYVVDRKGSITLTESGKQKEKEFHNKASEMAVKDNKRIVEKFINEPERRRTEIHRSHEKGQKYADEARSEINTKSYKTLDEKRATIDKVFTKKLRELENAGDDIAADEVWNQWLDTLDELELENN